MTKIIVSLSGGMDSGTLLAVAKSKGHEINAVGFRYGSKHEQWETQAAVSIVHHYSVHSRQIDLSPVMEGFRSNLMRDGGDIPEGHYEAESMKLTVVPGRNLIFASVLTGIAWSVGASEVWLGIHAGDHAIYPDCRPQWFEAMKKAVELGSDHLVTLKAPFLYVNKAEILCQGLKLGVPYQLTRTCYKDQLTACGRCGSCQERLASFRANGVEDPLPYESRGIVIKE